jgi:hypothetical protein
MTKHEEYYQHMVDENLDLFGDFQDIHDKYAKNPQIWQTKFNLVGEKVVEVIRDWERRLCRESERGQFGKFSASLADKFWTLVRKDYPKIDFVGVK